MGKSLSTLNLILFSSTLFIAISFIIPTGVYAEKDEYGRDLPDKIVPQKLKAEELHKDYREKDHRYRLAVMGDKLANRGTEVHAEWKTTCGRFYSKHNGILEAETPVIWGYEYPKEDCTDAVITVSIKDYLREDTAKIEQKVFFPEEKPKIEIFYKKHYTQAELKRKDFMRWIKIRIGSIWASLLPANQDARKFETPGGNGAVRN